MTWRGEAWMGSFFFSFFSLGVGDDFILQVTNSVSKIHLIIAWKNNNADCNFNLQ